MLSFDDALAHALRADGDDLLTMTTAEITELRDALIARQIELVYRGHRYYRDVMTRLKLRPGDIGSIEELQKLPVTSKRDFLADPEAFRLDCPDLPAEMRALWEVVYTTGTSTGIPAPIYTTTFDYHSYGQAAYRRRSLIPIRQSDMVVSLFPVTPHPGGAFSRSGAEVAGYGAAFVVANTGRPPEFFGRHRSLEATAELIVAHRATVLYGISGFVRRLLIHAERAKLDFSSVRMLMVSGEASSRQVMEDMRQRLLRLGSADALVINRYGSTEQGSSMVECTPGSGFHNLAPDQVYLESVDPETGARLPDGQHGAMAFSHLIRRGTILLRYAPGDAASITSAPCPHCGRTSSERMSADVHREGGIQKVKGTLVDVDSIAARLAAVSDLDEFQVVLRATDPDWPEAIDELLIRVACHDSVAAQGLAAVEGIVEEVARVRPRTERCAAAAIFDPEQAAKPRRIVYEDAYGRPRATTRGV
jgi:phenylacetate-CoA ligase